MNSPYYGDKKFRDEKPTVGVADRSPKGPQEPVIDVDALLSGKPFVFTPVTSDSPQMRPIVKYLKALSKNIGATNREVASKAHISSGHISQYRKSFIEAAVHLRERNPDYVHALCSIYSGVTIEEMARLVAALLPYENVEKERYPENVATVYLSQNPEGRPTGASPSGPMQGKKMYVPEFPQFGQPYLPPYGGVPTVMRMLDPFDQMLHEMMEIMNRKLEQEMMQNMMLDIMRR